MPETVDFSALWSEHAFKLKSIEQSATEADFAMRQALAALKGYRILKSDSNAPHDVDYGLVVELINELERIVSLD